MTVTRNVNSKKRFNKYMKEIDVLMNIKSSRIKSLRKRCIRKTCSQVKKRRRKIMLKPDENQKRMINSQTLGCMRLQTDNYGELDETKTLDSLMFLPDSCSEDSDITSPGSMGLQPDSCGGDTL